MALAGRRFFVITGPTRNNFRIGSIVTTTFETSDADDEYQTREGSYFEEGSAVELLPSSLKRTAQQLVDLNVLERTTIKVPQPVPVDGLDPAQFVDLAAINIAANAANKAGATPKTVKLGDFVDVVLAVSKIRA